MKSSCIVQHQIKHLQKLLEVLKVVLLYQRKMKVLNQVCFIGFVQMYMPVFRTKNYQWWLRFFTLRTHALVNWWLTFFAGSSTWHYRSLEQVKNDDGQGKSCTLFNIKLYMSSFPWSSRMLVLRLFHPTMPMFFMVCFAFNEAVCHHSSEKFWTALMYPNGVDMTLQSENLGLLFWHLALFRDFNNKVNGLRNLHCTM